MRKQHETSPWNFRFQLCIIILFAVLVIQNFYYLSNQASSVPDFPGNSMKGNVLDVVNSIAHQGAAKALPSIRITSEDEEKVKDTRMIYGGVGDKTHLGMYIRHI